MAPEDDDNHLVHDIDDVDMGGGDEDAGLEDEGQAANVGGGWKATGVVEDVETGASRKSSGGPRKKAAASRKAAGGSRKKAAPRKAAPRKAAKKSARKPAGRKGAAAMKRRAGSKKASGGGKKKARGGRAAKKR